jgi:hypothetical protein
MNIIALVDGIRIYQITIDTVPGDYLAPQQEKMVKRFLRGFLVRNPNLVSNSGRHDRLWFGWFKRVALLVRKKMIRIKEGDWQHFISGLVGNRGPLSIVWQ